MASSLMFKILTGASRDVRRYEMLRKIGVRRSMLTKSIYKEISYLFIFPAIIGISHVLVGLNLFSFILAGPVCKSVGANWDFLSHLFHLLLDNSSIV